MNIKTLSILAIAGTAVAAPNGWGNWGSKYFGGDHGSDNSDDNNGGNRGGRPQPQVDVDIVTAYTTVTQQRGYGGNYGGQPTATGAPVAQQTWTPVNSQPAASSPAPVASSGGDGYMGVVSQWRSAMGLSALSEDSKLVANALKTAQDGNGQMKHELNPGSFAQVLAPGSANDFEKVFVGGWLCERPNLPGLNGICGQMSQGWSYDGQTGHADILSSSKYSKIGCALATGIWACDLA